MIVDIPRYKGHNKVFIEYIKFDIDTGNVMLPNGEPDIAPVVFTDFDTLISKLRSKAVKYRWGRLKVGSHSVKLKRFTKREKIDDCLSYIHPCVKVNDFVYEALGFDMQFLYPVISGDWLILRFSYRYVDIFYFTIAINMEGDIKFWLEDYSEATDKGFAVKTDLLLGGI